MFFYSFAAVLSLTPLYKAGARPIPLLLLEIAAVGLLLYLAMDLRSTWGNLRALPITMLAAIAILLSYPLVQLVPLSVSTWSLLPGHTEYAYMLKRFGDDLVTASQWHAISLIPRQTEAAWLALLPPLSCFLAAMRLSPSQSAQLSLIMAIYAGGESLLGLLQVGTGGESIFSLRNSQAYGTATGTFVNHNHLAAMLAMTLPVMVGLLVYSMRPGRRRRNVARPASEAFARRAMLFGSAVMVLVCLLFTRSRAGIACALVGLAFSSILLVRARAAAEGSSRTRAATYVVFGLVAASLILAAITGIAPILARLEPDQLLTGRDLCLRLRQSRPHSW